MFNSKKSSFDFWNTLRRNDDVCWEIQVLWNLLEGKGKSAWGMEFLGLSIFFTLEMLYIRDAMHLYLNIKDKQQVW